MITGKISTESQLTKTDIASDKIQLGLRKKLLKKHLRPCMKSSLQQKAARYQTIHSLIEKKFFRPSFLALSKPT